MKPQVYLRRWTAWTARILSLALPFLAFALILSSPASSGAQSPLLPCSWPVKSTGHGITNVAFPDTDATYWLMPINTETWPAMIIKGHYPQSRFFSFTTYFQTGGAVDTIVDSNIAPDPGGVNPFAPPGSTSGSEDYTVTIDGNATDSGNHIHWGNTKLAYVIYRIYVADRGLGDKAGVPLPSVTLIGTDGNAHPVHACPSFLTAIQLPSLSTLLEDKISSSKGGATCPSSGPPQIEVTFSPNSNGGRFFPNPATKYVSARGLCSQPGRIIVIRGKAPVFPDTYNGSTIFQPAIPGEIQMRYWSMCNNEEVFPGPVVACQADHATALDDQGYYTYVVSPKESARSSLAPPSWVPPDATWLQWGDQNIANALLFREMLPIPGFALTGDYYPKGVYCDKDLFIKQGWQGCFAAAGVTAP